MNNMDIVTKSIQIEKLKDELMKENSFGSYRVAKHEFGMEDVDVHFVYNDKR